MNDEPAQAPPLIPPWWFVQRFNEANYPDPYRTALDPLVLLAWHTVTAWQRHPTPMVLISGC